MDLGEFLGRHILAATTLTIPHLLATMMLSTVVGMFIFFIYKLAYKGVVYSHSFNVTLVMVCVITSVIVLVVSANIMLTFGMIGALSIVRYRTAIKDPVDVAFLFWSITSGIIAGTGEALFLIIAVLILGVLVVALFWIRTSKNTFLLIIEADKTGSEELEIIVRSLSGKMKSKSLVQQRVELIFEMRLKWDADTSFLEKINDRSDVHSAVLVGYNGDFAE